MTSISSLVHVHSNQGGKDFSSLQRHHGGKKTGPTQQGSQPVLLCQQSKGTSQDTVQGPACALPAPGRAEHLCLACQTLVAGGVCRQRVMAHEWCRNLTVGEPWRAQPICPHSVHQGSELRQPPAESLCTWRERAFKPSSSSREKTGGSCSAPT